MISLVDTHAHLTSPVLAECVDQVLADANDVGVRRIITVATDVADSMRTVALAEQYAEGAPAPVGCAVFATVGIHPHEAGRVDDGDWSTLTQLLRANRVVALGEMGLDYHYDYSDVEDQKGVFGLQLELAASTDLPLVIHCREAVNDTIEMLHRHGFDGRRVVFHCFSGSADEAGRIAEHGWRVSFTGMVTFKNSQELQAIARAYPADSLMLETDSPYLSPEPVRKQRPNAPANVYHIAEFLAQLRGISVDELASSTTRNAEAFFRLPPV